MMDVAIRVESIRPFTVNQMSLLIENHHLFILGGTSGSAAREVLYAASWICGEFAIHLRRPLETLEFMILHGRISSFPDHIISVYIQNSVKLFVFIAEEMFEKGEGEAVRELAGKIEEKMAAEFL